MALSIETFGNIFIKILKLVINFIVIILYRVGFGGSFLGVGGTWNLNEDKNPDVEIIGSGVFVGFFIYTAVVVLSYLFGTTSHNRSIVDTLMNLVGAIMFIAVGGIALHYWIGYQSEHKYMSTSSEKQVGISVGVLCIIEGALYILDTVINIVHYANKS